MSYKIGDTFVSIHSNVNILEAKRKSFKELYIIRRATATITGLYRSRKVKTAYEVSFVRFSCDRLDIINLDIICSETGLTMFDLMIRRNRASRKNRLCIKSN